MKKNKIPGFLALFLLLLSAFAQPKFALAAFDISVTPFEGGTDLRFGTVKNYGPFSNKEVTVNITSDIGKQYQVVMALVEPFSNDQGMSLSSNNFTVYGVGASNKFGTLPIEQESSVVPGRMPLYTSNTSGQSDSFNLVFVLKNPFSVSSGYYHGRIAFTLEAISSTESPVTVILNVNAEIQIESGIEIKTATGAKFISLSSSMREAGLNNVQVEVKGGLRKQFRIFESLTLPLESSEGKRLPYEAVSYKISDAKYGTGPVQETALSGRMDELYTSGSGGDADKFVITYNLVEPEKLKAGTYRSSIKYFFESEGNQTLLDTYDIEVEVERVFDLVITPELGGVLEFRDLKPQSTPKQSEVTIEVKSNTGKQYQVSQQMLTGLVNREGKSIPKENFILREESLDTKGTLQSKTPTEVKIGDTVLFMSDREGSPDRFKVIYELIPSLDIMAGSYSTRITYSISEI